MEDSGSYVVWDVPGQPASLLVNLELADALKRAFSKRQRSAGGLFGILLGRSSLTSSHRTLVTLEDCEPALSGKVDIPEDATGLKRVGLVREDDAWYKPEDVLLVIERVHNEGPFARLVWRGEETRVPLDSVRLKAGGFTILHGSQMGKQLSRKPASAWRRWAWVPLVAGMIACAVLVFWPEHASEEPVPPEMAESAAPLQQPNPPVAPPKPPQTLAPKPVPSRSRRTPSPHSSPEGSIAFSPAPDSTARKLVNRAPSVPLLRRFQTKNPEDFVPARPIRDIKLAVPAELARTLPKDSRVDLRVTIDKNGQVSHVSVLGSSAHPEFDRLARSTVSGWYFEPARLHDRPVSSALDVTFRCCGSSSDR